MLKEISVIELAERMQGDNAPILIDVRESQEYEFAHIEGAQLKPLGDINNWANELDKDKEYVMQCHSGQRSAQATMMMQQMGFKNVTNLAGGIEAWSLQVDPNVPRY